MTLNDLLHPASIAGPFLVAYGVARLWVTRRHLFRRPARYVVDLPAYAGWGPTGIPPAPEPRPGPDYLRLMSGMSGPQWGALRDAQHWPKDAGEALHGSLDQRTRTYADGTPHLMHVVFAVMMKPTYPCGCHESAMLARQRHPMPEDTKMRRNAIGPPTAFEAEAVLNDMRRRDAEYTQRQRPSEEADLGEN